LGAMQVRRYLTKKDEGKVSELQTSCGEMDGVKWGKKKSAKHAFPSGTGTISDKQ